MASGMTAGLSSVAAGEVNVAGATGGAGRCNGRCRRARRNRRAGAISLISLRMLLSNVLANLLEDLVGLGGQLGIAGLFGHLQ